MRARACVRVGLVAITSIAGLATRASASESLDGFWMDSHGEVILDIRACPSGRCGKVAWLKQPLGPDGKPIKDYRNSDPKLQTRPVCGLEVVSGFQKKDDGTWGGGTVYVSDLGMSFSGHAEVLGADQVKVTGYVLVPLLGQSEVWSRVKGPPETCAQVERRYATPPAAPGAAKAAESTASSKAP